MDLKWVDDFCRRLAKLRLEMNQPSLPGKESDFGKRQTRFEFEAVEMAKEALPAGCRLEAEGYNPVGPEDAEWILGLDPTDGTAGDARGAGSLFIHGLPVSAVVAIRRNVPNSMFGSVTFAGIVDLHRGRVYTASSDAFQLFDPRGQVLYRLSRKDFHKNYNNHSPCVAGEVARRANSFLRFLIPYGLYPEFVADSHSSAMVMLWAVQGYIDAWLNFNLPGIDGAGQRGHELGAIAVFARAMGACALQTKVEGNQVVIAGPLDEAPYTFDGQTSCILGPDRKIVEHYLGLINAGLAREVKLEWDGSVVSIPLGEVLAGLYRQYPNERWSLPLVHDV